MFKVCLHYRPRAKSVEIKSSNNRVIYLHHVRLEIVPLSLSSVLNKIKTYYTIKYIIKYYQHQSISHFKFSFTNKFLYLMLYGWI